MALEEKTAFINDPQPDMSTREKNEFLSAKLTWPPMLIGRSPPSIVWRLGHPAGGSFTELVQHK